MAEIRHSPQSEADLEAILEYLHQNQPTVAERYATAFYEKGAGARTVPEMGRLRPEIAPNLRSTLVHPYVLFYRVEGETVQIVRILHGKRDLRRIFQEESD